MQGFIILLNILSVFFFLFCLFFLLFLRKWAMNEYYRMEKKQKEVTELLETADEMINELNKFSDYIVRDVEDKANEVKQIINELDSVVEEKKQKIQKQKDNLALLNSGATYNLQKNHVLPKLKRTEHKQEQRAIDLGNKSMQILKLSGEGLDEAEIAKKLNIGRGEIQLVLGMKKELMKVN